MWSVRTETLGPRWGTGHPIVQLEDGWPRWQRCAKGMVGLQSCLPSVPLSFGGCNQTATIGGMGPQRGLDRFGYWRQSDCIGSPLPFLDDNTLVPVVHIAQRAFYPRPKLREGGLKGCWFFVAPGSDTYISIGRSLRAGTRVRAVQLLGLNMTLPPHYPFALDYQPVCEATQKLGFDTIQYHNQTRVRRFTDAIPEIVVCRRECTDSKPSFDDACAGNITVYRGDGSRCSCDNKQRILNCAGTPAGESETNGENGHASLHP